MIHAKENGSVTAETLFLQHLFTKLFHALLKLFL